LAAATILLLSVITSWYFSSRLSVSYQQQSLQHYLHAQQKDAQQVVNDTTLMRKLILHQETKEEFERLAKKNYGLFLFAETIGDNQDLLFWNNQKIIPPKADFDSTYGTFFQQLLNGYYVIQKSKLALPGMSNNVIAYVLVPVLYKYYVETSSSQTQFAHNREAIKKINIAERPTEFPILSLDKKTLFYVQQAPPRSYEVTDPVTIVLRLTALVFLLIALHLYAESIYRKKGALKSVLFLALALLAIRLIIYGLPLVFSLRRFTLFDPAVYASDFINKSLGDLLINAVLLCWIILFTWNRLGPLKKLPSFLKGKGILLAGITGIFILMYTTFQLAFIVNNLVVNSKISFQVTDFSQLDIFTAISFLVLALLSLSYYYFSRLLFRFILLAFPNLLYLYFTVAAVGLLFLTFQGSHDVVLFQLPVLMWLVCFTLLLTQEQSIINRFRFTIASLLFWMFVFSISLAALIMQGNREREKVDRKEVAKKTEELVEPTKESVLTIALTYFDSTFLKNNFKRFYGEPENSVIRDSITNTSLATYASVYHTNIYVYDSAGHPVNNPDNTAYEELNNIYTAHSRPSANSAKNSVKGLLYYETSPTQFVYLVRRQVYDTTAFLGTVFVIATPRLFQEKQTLEANIFSRKKSPEEDKAYIRAVYKNRQLVQYSGNYPFATQLSEKDIPENEFSNREENDYDQLWYKASNHKIIVVARKKDSFIESITLFSYLFCAFLFMVGVIRLFGLGARIARSWPRVDVFSRLSIRSQIHVTIIFISVLSFVIIGAATITFFEKRYQRNNIERLSRTATGTQDEIQKRLKEDSLDLTATVFQDTASREKLRKLVSDISDVHDLIINIYDLNGNLQITSNDEIYRKGVLSTKMDPTAFYHLASMQEVQKVQNEQINDLEYLSIYSAVRSPDTQETYAYLNIPSFTSQTALNQEISNFLVTIINLNAFIVLIAGVIALFITNRITRSFSVISDKMKEVTLGRTNEEIEWNKEDEIGELIRQYNKMVRQLEDSASALAKSEREGAWREMARQVAHEIKNPLTPMKLSIQYLQKAIQNNQPNVKELTTNVASTLIEQIDHLSKIAADFSQFANIGTKRLEVVDLHNVIGSLLDLYSTNPKVQLEWKALSQELIMHVDKTHMNRLFTNLLTNAVDACSERNKCVVTISEKIVSDDVVISITDNGDGIPAEMRSKIFTPNFTTKTSGTGLGLAMCKGIVEQAGGHIWFETKEGEGTTFFVQLPLIRS
jgi:signal transduction histidine kinase